MNDRHNKIRNLHEIVLFTILAVGVFVLPLGHYLDSTKNIATPIYERRVCAFYYPWYGNQTEYFGENPNSAGHICHWDESHPDYDPPIIHNPLEDPFDIASAQTPTLGGNNITLYDSCDPDAIKFHIDTATNAGIDTFICSWWGPNSGTDYNFRQVLNVTEMYNSTMRHTIYFETCQDRFSSENPEGVQNLVTFLKYVLDNYGNHSRFLKIQDNGQLRPVIFIYAITCRPSIENWTAAINTLHQEGYNPFLIGDIGSPKQISDELLAIFDGFHVYNPYGIYLNDPNSAIDKFNSLVVSARRNGKLSCTTVLPGYNDTQVRHGNQPLKRNGGLTYQRSWDVALASNPDWVLICTFNEWHEGTEIEPSLENGTFYINMTREYITKFK
ncbi:MAG: hypothetical protein ACTSRA_15975 [Promethearchaeota archaeon]